MLKPTTIEKEGYTEEIEQEESFVEEIPAAYYGDPKNQIHYINRFLSKHTKSKLSVLELMVKDNGCKIIKPQNWIVNPAGELVHPGQLFLAYNMVPQGNLRCVICNNIFNFNTILEHLQGTYENGHKLSTAQTIDLFSREFYDWNVKNSYEKSGFEYKGSDIEF